jgi:bacteriorhodopsin
MTSQILEKSVFISLGVQILTGIIDTVALNYEVKEGKEILKSLLGMELGVQIVEGIFYTWLAFSIKSAQNITSKRYFDWALTTPTMLITLSAYLNYLKKEEKGEKQDTTIVESIKNNYKQYLAIIILNAVMLLFGYLAETDKIPTKTGVFIGFIPFIIYFGIIYYYYGRHSKKGNAIFWPFASLWSIYGLAALLPYIPKNITYNILDIFAKNFFGLFLSYLVYSNRKITANS